MGHFHIKVNMKYPTLSVCLFVNVSLAKIAFSGMLLIFHNLMYDVDPYIVAEMMGIVYIKRECTF